MHPRRNFPHRSHNLYQIGNAPPGVRTARYMDLSNPDTGSLFSLPAYLRKIQLPAPNSSFITAIRAEPTLVAAHIRGLYMPIPIVERLNAATPQAHPRRRERKHPQPRLLQQHHPILLSQPLAAQHTR